MAPTLTRQSAGYEFKRLADEFRCEANRQTRPEDLYVALRLLRIRGGHLVHESAALLPAMRQERLRKELQSYEEDGDTPRIDGSLSNDAAERLWWETAALWFIEDSPHHVRNPCIADVRRKGGATTLAQYRSFAQESEEVCRYMAEMIRQGAGPADEPPLKDPWKNPNLSRSTRNLWERLRKVEKPQTTDDMEAWTFSRKTVIKAVKELEAEGYITRCKGGGVLPKELK